jgi:predicted hydrocarbon binding protein
MTIKYDRENVAQVHEYYKKSTVIDFENGRLNLDELPIIWARAELLYDIHSEIYKVVGDAVHALVRKIALPYGINFCKWLEKNFEERGGELSRESMLGFMCSETLAIGWGAVEIEDEGNTIAIIAKKGFPVGQLYRDNGHTFPHPVDSYMVGYFEGFFSKLDKAVYSVIETDCVGKGDELCRIILQKR